jgi:4-hydroxy-tetrahydrodipicolinate reductase
MRPAMKIALLGYGKMGRLVEELARRDGWQIGPKLDIHNNAGGTGISVESMKGVDVAVDFSEPAAVISNIEACARARLNVVVGTTGWGAERSRAEILVRDSGIGLVHGPNFSVGMNLFYEIVGKATEIMGKAPQYDPYLLEQHHRAKRDAPSGTAIALVELMKSHLGNLQMSIACTRAGHIPGIHIVGFDSEADTVVLEHRARNRKGFAEGALLAARGVAGKSGFYDFRDVFREVLGF